MPLTEKAIAALSDDQLLDAIIEEAAEIIYTASKAKRYGLAHVHPDKPGARENIVEIGMENVQIGNLVRWLGAKHGHRYADLCEMVRLAGIIQEERGVSFDKFEERRK